MSCKFIANRHDRSCNNEILSTSSPNDIGVLIITAIFYYRYLHSE